MLKDLCNYYDYLVRMNKIIPHEYSEEKITYVIDLTADGQIHAIFPLNPETSKNGKIIPSIELLPFRTGTVYFPESRPKYFLGLKLEINEAGEIPTFAMTDGGKPSSYIKNFEKCKAHNLQMLEGLHSPVIDAYRNFLSNWNPEAETKNAILLDFVKSHSNAATTNYAFCVDSSMKNLLHEDPALKERWETYFNSDARDTGSNYNGICAVTGKYGPIARTHNSIKLPGCSSASMICCNSNAVEGCGHTQSNNCSVSVEAMEKYTRALQYLTNDSNQKKHLISDKEKETYTVFWSMDPNEEAEDFVLSLLYKETKTGDSTFERVHKLLNSGKVTQNEVNAALTNLADVEFHILEMHRESSRISVRNYTKNTLSDVIYNLAKFQQSLMIQEDSMPLSFKTMTDALLPPVAKKQNLSAKRLLEIQDSAFQNGYLSEALGLMALNKYHTEFYAKDRKWARLNTQLSMIKSWLTNTNKESEELIEMLNKENTNPGYLMGRLMAVADQIQHSAKGKSTLSKDYGRIASKNPVAAMRTVMPKMEYYLKDLKEGSKVYYQKLLDEIMDKMPNHNIPIALYPRDTGNYYVGLAQQRNDFFTKKADVEGIDEDAFAVAEEDGTETE